MSPVLDEADALGRVGGDRDLLLEMIACFAEQKGNDLPEVEAAYAARDARRLQFAAHSLKGGAGTLGGREAWECGKRVEDLARAADWAALEAAVPALLDAVTRFDAELAGFAERLRG